MGPYARFLREVVLPSTGTFAGLVTWGELLAGVSLTLGLGTRIGAAVAVFLFLNYGLMGGTDTFSLHAHLGLSAIVIAACRWGPGAAFGADRLLGSRWPGAPAWLLGRRREPDAERSS